jgi:hypothetical protein
MAKFTHEITMSNYGLTEDDLSQEAVEALEDFNSYLEQLQDKKEQALEEGQEFELTDAQRRKINRLSASVSEAVEDMIEVDDSAEAAPANPPRQEKKSEAGFDLFAWLK